MLRWRRFATSANFANRSEPEMTAKWTVAPSHEELSFLVEAGVIYREAGNFQAALDVFNGVKALYPTHDFPEVFLGTVEFQQRNFDAAEGPYRKAIELNP